MLLDFRDQLPLDFLVDVMSSGSLAIALPSANLDSRDTNYLFEQWFSELVHADLGLCFVFIVCILIHKKTNRHIRGLHYFTFFSRKESSLGMSLLSLERVTEHFGE